MEDLIQLICHHSAWILVCLIPILLLFLYTGAPIVSRLPFKNWYVETEDEERQYIRSGQPKLPNPTIHLPWKRKPGGYFNIEAKDEKSWLEIDFSLPRQIYVMNKSLVSMEIDGRTFAVHPKYKERIREASFELLHMVISNMQAFHPELVTVTDDGCKLMHNITGSVWKIDRSSDVHPLMVTRQLIGDDIALMMKDEEGLHILAGAIIAFPDDWKLEEKLGLPLAAIHYPVHVLNTAREDAMCHTVPSSSPVIKTMEYFFNSLYSDEDKKDKIFERFNYTFQQHPYLNNRFDDIFHTFGDALQHISSQFIFGTFLEARIRNQLRRYLVHIVNYIRYFVGLKQLDTFLRTERQTLRLLPKTQAVAFLIRTQVNSLQSSIRTRDDGESLKAALNKLNPERDNSARVRFKFEVLDFLRFRFPNDTSSS